MFRRPTDAAVLYAHVDEPPTPASAVRAELPVAVDAVFAAGLAKDPAARPATASAFVDALAQALGASAGTLDSPPFTHGAPPATRRWRQPPHCRVLSSRRRPRSGARPAPMASASRPDGLGDRRRGRCGGARRLRTRRAHVDGPPPPAVGAGLVAIGSDLRGEGIIAGGTATAARRPAARRPARSASSRCRGAR